MLLFNCCGMVIHLCFNQKIIKDIKPKEETKDIATPATEEGWF